MGGRIDLGPSDGGDRGLGIFALAEIAVEVDFELIYPVVNAVREHIIKLIINHSNVLGVLYLFLYRLNTFLKLWGN